MKLSPIVLATALAACGSPGEPSAPATDPAPAPAPATDPAPAPAPATDPAPAPTTTPAGVELAGTLLKKPWSKSLESWNAGGSDYYVLDVGDAPVEEQSAAEGVTLIATDAVTADQLDTLVGKRVVVTGNYVQAQPYTPQSPMEQYPTDMNGQPLPRGAGFAARAIAEAP